jgi:hypothetical protein
MSLIIYILTVVVISLLMYKTCHTIWASLLYGLVLGIITLIIIQPPSSIDPYSTGVESTSALYLLIFFLTPVYIAIYSLKIAYYDYR